MRLEVFNEGCVMMDWKGDIKLWWDIKWMCDTIRYDTSSPWCWRHPLWRCCCNQRPRHTIHFSLQWRGSEVNVSGGEQDVSEIVWVSEGGREGWVGEGIVLSRRINRCQIITKGHRTDNYLLILLHRPSRTDWSFHTDHSQDQTMRT